MWRAAMLRSLGAAVTVIQAGCVAHCVLEFGADFVVCSGPSMLPTIKPKDIVLSEHVSVYQHKVQPGDIVIVKSPINPPQFLCKRVTKMEGDIIDEPPEGYSKKYVPRDHVWLEGDNRENSSDSRKYGPVPYGLIRGRVFYKIWPPSEAGSLTDPPPVLR